MKHHTVIQTDLFGGGAVDLPLPIPVAPGRFALQGPIATTMARAIAPCPMAREDIAGRMTALTGKRLTLAGLNALTAMSRPDHTITLIHAMAFDAVVAEAGGVRPLLALYAEVAGGRVIFGEEIVALEMGKVARAQAALRERNAYLKRVSGRRA